MFNEDSDERTFSDVQGEDVIQNDEDDIANNNEIPIV